MVEAKSWLLLGESRPLLLALDVGGQPPFRPDECLHFCEIEAHGTAEEDVRHSREPQIVQDIFGVKGLGFLRALKLPAPDGLLLAEQLNLHDMIAQQMRAQEKRIASEFRTDPTQARLLTVPGIGRTLAAVIACEIDGIERSPNADKLCSCAGIVPTTHASGGKFHHGPLLPFCNKWLICRRLVGDDLGCLEGGVSDTSTRKRIGNPNPLTRFSGEPWQLE